MKIGKDKSIPFYFSLFLAGALLAANDFTPKIPIRYLPITSSRAFQTFENRLESYLEDRNNPDFGKIVIVGPSYAYDLGYIAPISDKGKPFRFYNLGVSGNSFSDSEYIIKRFCSENDQIVYVLNVTEAGSQFEFKLKARPLIKSKFARRSAILRDYSRNLLGILNDDDNKMFGEMTRELSEKEAKQFKHILGNSNAPGKQLQMLAIDFDMYLSWVNSLEITSYKRLQQEYPHLIYAIIPVIPTKGLSEDQPYERRLMYFQNLEKELLQRFGEEGVSFIYPKEGVLNPEDYTDIQHLTSDGQREYNQFLRENICQPNFLIFGEKIVERLSNH